VPAGPSITLRTHLWGSRVHVSGAVDGKRAATDMNLANGRSAHQFTVG
jgi:hypothetical protein